MSEEKTISFKAKTPDGREVECPAPDQKEWEDTGEGDKKIPEKDQKEISIGRGDNKTFNIATYDKDKETGHYKGTVTHEIGKCYLSDMDRHLHRKSKLTSYTIWKKKQLGKSL